jgi:serine/threonine protein kinase
MPRRNQPSDCDPRELSSPLGRYRLHQAISVGTIASVHVGFFEGPEQFRNTVAIKRLLPGVAHEPAELAQLAYEACVGALIHHPNVVSVLDLGKTDNGPFVVTEYVLGETIAGLIRTCGRFPIPIAVAIVGDALRGLHAAHTAKDAAGEPLDIVHRNVCPDNILVGVDGVARLIDFGASVSSLDSMTIPNGQHETRRAGVISPEHLMGWPVDGRADVFATAVVLWELVAGSRPFRTHGAYQAFLTRPTRRMPPASAFNVEVVPALEAVMERALAWSPRHRFESAVEFAEALEKVVAPSSRAEVGEFVNRAAETRLAVQRKLLGAIDAPYGRISALPSKAKRAEPVAVASSPPKRMLPTPSRTRRHSRLGELRAVIAGPLAPTRRAFVPWSQVVLSFERWAARGKILVLHQGSTILASLSLLCLLLAAARASFVRRPAPAPEMAVAAAAAPAPYNDQCPPVASPPPTTEPTQVAARPAAASSAPEPIPASVRRPAPAAERGSCDPPFTIDSAGIRRLKIDCM